MKQLTTPQYEVDPGGSGYCTMNGRETPSTTGKKTVSKNAFPGTKGLSFPLTKVMYALDIEYSMLAQAYFLHSDPQRGFGRTHG